MITFLITFALPFVLMVLALYGGRIDVPMIPPVVVVGFIIAGVIHHIRAEVSERYYQYRNQDFFGCDIDFPVKAWVALWIHAIGNGTAQIALLLGGFANPLLWIFEAGLMASDGAIHIVMNRVRKRIKKTPGYTSAIWALLPATAYLVVNNWPGDGDGQVFAVVFAAGCIPFTLNILWEWKKAHRRHLRDSIRP